MMPCCEEGVRVHLEFQELDVLGQLALQRLASEEEVLPILNRPKIHHAE